MRRCPTTSNAAERRHHTRLQPIDYQPTRLRRSPPTKHSTRWGGGSNCCSDETSTRHGGVLSAHLALLHRYAGSSVIYSYLSKEERGSTRNVLSHSELIAPSPPSRKHTKSTLDIFRLRHRSKAYETYSLFTTLASVPTSKPTRMSPETDHPTAAYRCLVPLLIRLRPLAPVYETLFSNSCSATISNIGSQVFRMLISSQPRNLGHIAP